MTITDAFGLLISFGIIIYIILRLAAIIIINALVKNTWGSRRWR